MREYRFASPAPYATRHFCLLVSIEARALEAGKRALLCMQKSPIMHAKETQYACHVPILPPRVNRGKSPSVHATKP